MKRFIKQCALVGLILLLAGSGITAGAFLMGGRYPNTRFRHTFPFWHGFLQWTNRWDDVYDW